MGPPHKNRVRVLGHDRSWKKCVSIWPPKWSDVMRRHINFIKLSVLPSILRVTLWTEKLLLRKAVSDLVSRFVYWSKHLIKPEQVVPLLSNDTWLQWQISVRIISKISFTNYRTDPCNYHYLATADHVITLIGLTLHTDTPRGTLLVKSCWSVW